MFLKIHLSVPVSHLEQIKIFGEIHDDIKLINEFTFIIKDDRVGCICNIKQKKY